MQASQHSPAIEHMGRHGLISLFEVVALTPCCRYKVRNCLLTCEVKHSARTYQSNEVSTFYRQCGVGSKHFHSDPEVTGMPSARGGFTGLTVEETNTSREITPTRSTCSGLTVWGYGSSIMSGKAWLQAGPDASAIQKGRESVLVPSWLDPYYSGWEPETTE